MARHKQHFLCISTVPLGPLLSRKMRSTNIPLGEKITIQRIIFLVEMLLSTFLILADPMPIIVTIHLYGYSAGLFFLAFQRHLVTLMAKGQKLLHIYMTQKTVRPLSWT